MDKETITQYKDQSEAKCRELFDQLQTLQSQATQIEVELERTRGDFRTFTKLLDEWQELTTSSTLTSPLPVFSSQGSLEELKPVKKEKAHV